MEATHSSEMLVSFTAVHSIISQESMNFRNVTADTWLRIFKSGLTNSSTCVRFLSKTATGSCIPCDCEAMSYLGFCHLGHMHPSDCLDAPLSKVLHFLQSVGLFGAEQKGMQCMWACVAHPLLIYSFITGWDWTFVTLWLKLNLPNAVIQTEPFWHCDPKWSILNLPNSVIRNESIWHCCLVWNLLSLWPKQCV
jgi:hypothetical protein